MMANNQNWCQNVWGNNTTNSFKPPNWSLTLEKYYLNILDCNFPWTDKSPTCDAIVAIRNERGEACGRKAEWWHPMSASYCHSHISQGQKR